MDASIRRLVRDRARGRGEYCGLAEVHVYIRHHIDPIRPKQHGGDDSVANLALACQGCNLKKGANLAGIDPEGGVLAALSNPREQTWTEHFVFQGDRIVRLTPVGRATVQVLDMNARERMKIRAEVRAIGDFKAGD